MHFVIKQLETFHSLNIGSIRSVDIEYLLKKLMNASLKDQTNLRLYSLKLYGITFVREKY